MMIKILIILAIVFVILFLLFIKEFKECCDGNDEIDLTVDGRIKNGKKRRKYWIQV